jgi:hypothetical protein
VSKLGDLVLRQKLRVNAALALQHFSQFDGRYLATKISSRLKD